MSLPNLEDTIAAISTAPGEGGIAVVRVSGSEASGIGRSVLRTRRNEMVELKPRTARVVWAVDPHDGRLLDEALVVWMPGPASYTREDVLEIQTHGGLAAARAVLGAVLRCGARLAVPGEFTLRAFLNGRIDLVQAEAVLDVIRAQTEEALTVHRRLLDGALSREVMLWQDALGRAAAEIEARLDFPDEEFGEPDRFALLDALGGLLSAMEGKIASFQVGAAMRDGFTAALVGAPNTGKSSLLNAVLREDRAIVSALPGTTRDIVEGWTSAKGLPIRVVDTAGLRKVGDVVEAEGVRRARKAAATADVVLLVCDGGRVLLEDEIEEAVALGATGRGVAVVNKADLGVEPAAVLEATFGRAPVLVSALTGQGIPELVSTLGERAWQGHGPGLGAPLTRARHRAAVERAARCVRAGVEVLAAGGYEDVVANEIHGARRALGDLIGSGSPEDVLDRIFSEFCVGK